MSEQAVAGPEIAGSLLAGSLPIEVKLDRARTELLDLSARNRLLNIPRSARTTQTIEVIDERSSEIFRLLVRENRTFTFLAGRPSKSGAVPSADDEPDEIAELAQPEDDSINERGVLNRHADTKLQTRLTSAGLQKRLLDLHADAKTLEEEQGVNILYLALGTLKWIDPINASNIRYAPLVLIPVALERGTAAERFKLKWRLEEPAANLSLEAFLDRLHGLKLPAFDSGDDLDLAAYFSGVSESISSKAGWSVLPDDIVLGFFSFAKFLMYRDLDPALWPEDGKLSETPLIRSLLSDGFASRETMAADDTNIDSLISPEQMCHIVDSDSSQTLAVHDVRAGHSLVIQGPPGTGKSQTIANIIASAVSDGKTVLFVAEKMAALEVVKRRLDNAGAGDACLELHSNKANKKALLDELRRTWELGSPKGNFADSLITKLIDARNGLNEHARRIHRVQGPGSLTPYQVIGELVRLRDQGSTPTDLHLERAEAWSADDFHKRESLLGELVQRVEDIGRPLDHPWWGIGLESILPMQVERLVRRIGELRVQLVQMENDQQALSEQLEVQAATSFLDLQRVLLLARRVAAAPPGVDRGLAAQEWDDRRSEIGRLIQSGFEYTKAESELRELVRPSSWSAEVEGVRQTLRCLPNEFGQASFARAERLAVLLPQLGEASSQLRRLLELPGDDQTLAVVKRTLQIGKSVASAPQAARDTFTSATWDHGVEQISDLIEAIVIFQDAKLRVGNRLSDAAWTTDCRSARKVLAAKGTSVFRFMSGEWRDANRLVKSLITSPDLPLSEVLSILEVLYKGQKAKNAIRKADALGLSAFGPKWRAERSDTGELRSFLDWMRGLGLWAKEIRAIASRMENQEGIGVAANCLEAISAECFPLLSSIKQDCPALDIELLSPMLQWCSEVTQAYKRSGEILSSRPSTSSELLLHLNRLQDYQEAKRVLSANEALGKACFGGAWNGANSSWSDLLLASQWIEANGDIRCLSGRIESRSDLNGRTDAIESLAKSLIPQIEALLTDLNAEVGILFGKAKANELPPKGLIARLDTWLANPEQLSKWVAYRERSNRARVLGLSDLIDRIDQGKLPSSEANRTFRQAYYEGVLADQVREEPALGRFDGHVHGRLAREFAELDLQRIAAAKLEVVRAHHARIPQTGGGIGPTGALRAEIAKRRGHIPIRQLVSKAAPAMQALKPVWMMSPLSVAQFLPPGQLKFDILVMDEASQIQPVDALGAIARCHQVVVVGDERQLPPTRFFAKMTGSQGEDDDGETAQVADIESILGLFTARGLPRRMLRWHYRSRHQSLIAVSNTQFYENKLFIVPSPYTSEAGMGVLFHHVPDGRFDSGNTRTNLVEAKLVAEAVIRHAIQHPEHSLGVATFSANQRRAIRDQIELLRRANPSAENFFHAHSSEPFFVKNLENIQGDERDVIFISVGYGMNLQGSMSMFFGPLSSEGGERRLNVLISRAKRRCEVFSSITDEDIDTERGKGKGVFAFKMFLCFARTGRLSSSLNSGPGDKSVFETQVADALQRRGYQVHPQVGIAGCFVDLAIGDPERPGRYILGIECDGPSYNGARSARDRDRLRQSVLEDHGWIIHRIWSTDWFQRPKDQLERTIAAIEAARAELDSQSNHRVEPSRLDLQIVTIVRDQTTEFRLSTADSPLPHMLYEEASLNRPPSSPELHETHPTVLSLFVDQIVSTEGPIHVEELTARIRSAWGLHRSGGRIQSAVENAVAQSIKARNVELRGDFLSIPGTVAKVRDRTNVSSANLRRPEMLPPSEVKEAVMMVINKNLGGNHDEVVQTVLRLFGFRSTSAQLREVVQEAIASLLADDRLARQGDYLVSASHGS